MNATLTAICLFLSLGSPQYRNDSGSSALMRAVNSKGTPMTRLLGAFPQRAKLRPSARTPASLDRARTYGE